MTRRHLSPSSITTEAADASTDVTSPDLELPFTIPTATSSLRTLIPQDAVLHQTMIRTPKSIASPLTTATRPSLRSPLTTEPVCKLWRKWTACCADITGLGQDGDRATGSAIRAACGDAGWRSSAESPS